MKTILLNKHTNPLNGPLSRTTQVSRYQNGKTNLDFTEARDSEWQWHQLGHMQVCTSLQTDNHTNTSSLSFLQAGCPSCRPTNSVKALKQHLTNWILEKNEVNAKPVGQRFCPVTHARTHGRTSKKHNAVAGCGSKHGQQRQNNSSASQSRAILPSTLLQQKANWTNTV